VKKTTRKHLILIVAIAAALALALVAAWHVGAWRWFDAYAGRTFALRLHDVPRREVVYRFRLWQKTDRSVFDRTMGREGTLWEGESRFVTLRPDKNAGHLLVALLMVLNLKDENDSAKVCYVSVWRVDRNAPDIHPSVLAVPRRGYPLQRWIDAIRRLPLLSGSVGQAWRQEDFRVGPRASVDSSMRLTRVGMDGGRLCAFLTENAKWCYAGETMQSIVDGRTDIVLDLKQGVLRRLRYRTHAEGLADRDTKEALRTVRELEFVSATQLGESEMAQHRKRLKGLDEVIELVNQDRPAKALQRVRSLIEEEPDPDWREGMESSLWGGLQALALEAQPAADGGEGDQTTVDRGSATERPQEITEGED